MTLTIMTNREMRWVLYCLYAMGGWEGLLCLDRYQNAASHGNKKDLHGQLVMCGDARGSKWRGQ